MPETATSRQLTLDLGHRPALGRDDFLVAPGNQIAVRWIDRWPNWPGLLLGLHGPAGCGKSHLVQVWRAASQAVAIDPAELGRAEAPALLGAARVCALDAVERRCDGDRGMEEGLLHLVNLVAERRGHLLITGRRPPAHWPIGLADLRSRLSAAQAVGLGAPDDPLLGSLLVKLFADRQLKVGEEVLNFMLARMERSFAAARDLVPAIDRAALASGRKVTVPLVRVVLEDLERRARPNVDT